MPDEIILRQIGPAAVLHVVARRLMVFIDSHSLALYREFVDSTRAYCRSCLRSKNKTLRKFRIVDIILERTIVESGNIHHSREIIVHNCIRRIHTLSHSARIIVFLYNILKTQSRLAIALGPLIRHFVADAPHNYRGIVAVVAHHVLEVTLHPFVEEKIIAVLTLGFVPLVESLHHKHHTHFICSLDKLGCRHVVRCTDGICAHILEDAYLATDSSIVDSRTEHSEIMMLAYALEFHLAAIEEETFVGTDLNGSDSERLLICIGKFVTTINIRHYGI